MPLKNEPGWTGTFTRNEALGAWRNGTRIVKAKGEPGDATPLGTLGTVLGSIAYSGQVAYFVEWDDKPKLAVGVMGWKLGWPS